MLVQGLRKEFHAKSFKWEMVEEIERPRIVSARAAPYDGKDLIAQIVLRMHTKQVLQYMYIGLMYSSVYATVVVPCKL